MKSILKTCVKRVDCCLLSVDEDELDLKDDDLSKGLAVILVLNLPIERLEFESDIGDEIVTQNEERIFALKDVLKDIGVEGSTIYVGLTDIRGVDKSALVLSSYSELVKRKLHLFREDGSRLQETISDRGLACKRILRKGALNRISNRIDKVSDPNDFISFIEETLQKLEEVEFSERLEDGAVQETVTLIFLDADYASDLASVLEGGHTFIRLLLPKNQKLSNGTKKYFEELLSGISVSHEDRQVVIRCSLSFDALKQGYSLFWEKSIPEKL